MIHCLLCLNVCFLKQQLHLACHSELVTPKRVDCVSFERVVLAGINYRIFAFVICRYVEVTISAECPSRKTLKKGDSFQDLDIDRRILLKCILSRNGRCGLGLAGLV